VDLTKDLVDVEGVGFLPLAFPLLVAGRLLLGLGGLLHSLSGDFRRHGCQSVVR